MSQAQMTQQSSTQHFCRNPEGPAEVTALGVPAPVTVNAPSSGASPVTPKAACAVAGGALRLGGQPHRSTSSHCEESSGCIHLP